MPPTMATHAQAPIGQLPKFQDANYKSEIWMCPNNLLTLKKQKMFHKFKILNTTAFSEVLCIMMNCLEKNIKT